MESGSPSTNVCASTDPNEAADFSVKDAQELLSHVQREQKLINKKQRWLTSMIPKPDGSIRIVKRPKFLKDVYLRESDVRSDEVSSERVRVYVHKCFGFGVHFNGNNHHVVEDGIQIFNLRKGKDGCFCPASLKIMDQTISKLSNDALLSVANIATHNQINFEKIRPKMKKVIKNHLPKYLGELGDEESKSPLYSVLTNPYSYQSDDLSCSTPVSAMLLSSINNALDGLDEMPVQALVVMNRKLIKKSCPPIFLNKAQARSRRYLVSMIYKRCGKLISKLEVGNCLPKKLAKALSVMNLYRKLTLRSMDISQSAFFPFSRRVMSLQNDVMNALWSLQNANLNELKLLRPILCKGSKFQMVYFKVALKRYLIECLFECDEGNLPDEALRAVAFLIRMATKHKQIILTEGRMEEEVEAVLDLSSRFKSLFRCVPEGFPSDEMSLGSDKCSEDNDFTLTETNYFNFGSQQQKMDEGCCSNFTSNVVDMSGTCRDKSCIAEAKDSVPHLDNFLARSPERFAVRSGHCIESEAACSMMDPPAKKEIRCSEEALSEICDETAIVAHKLIGKILQNVLIDENKEVDGLTKGYLGGDSICPHPQAENQEADIVIQAIRDVLPNLSESCMDKVTRVLQVRMDADHQKKKEVDESNYLSEEALKEADAMMDADFRKLKEETKFG